eukprot:g3085.t1
MAVSKRGALKLALLAVLAVLRFAQGAAAAAGSSCSLDAGLPAHATIEGTQCKSELPVGEFCFATCEAGFENKKVGASAGMLTCLDNQSVPTLSLMEFGACAKPPCVVDDTTLPSNAIIEGSDCKATLSNSKFCSPKCAFGYRKEDPKGFVACKDGTLVLDTFGSCAPPLDPHGLRGTCTGELHIGASCSLACEDGYEIETSESNSGKRTCTADGTTKDFLVCTKVQLRCDGANDVPFGGTAGNCPEFLTAEESCEPACLEGYAPSGMRKCTEIGTLEDTFECTEVTPDSPGEGDNAGAGTETADRGDDAKGDKNKNNDNSKATDAGSDCSSHKDCEFCSAATACVWTQTDYVMYVATQCESKRHVASSGNSPITCAEQVDNFYRIFGGLVFAIIVVFILAKRFKDGDIAESQSRAANRVGAVKLSTTENKNSVDSDDEFDVESWGGQGNSGGDSENLEDLDDWDAFSDDDSIMDTDRSAKSQKSSNVPTTIELSERKTASAGKDKSNARLSPIASHNQPTARKVSAAPDREISLLVSPGDDDGSDQNDDAGWDDGDLDNLFD